MSLLIDHMYMYNFPSRKWLKSLTTYSMFITLKDGDSLKL